MGEGELILSGLQDKRVKVISLCTDAAESSWQYVISDIWSNTPSAHGSIWTAFFAKAWISLCIDQETAASMGDRAVDFLPLPNICLTHPLQAFHSWTKDWKQSLHLPHNVMLELYPTPWYPLPLSWAKERLTSDEPKRSLILSLSLLQTTLFLNSESLHSD